MSGIERLHVDLCTGLGGWSDPFRDADGWRSVGIDIRDDLKADVVADVRNLPLDCTPDLLTMSPPCTEFSRYSMPWLNQPNPSTELVEACRAAVQDLSPTWWVLENVRGLKQFTGIQERKRVGPYYLWGEFPPFDVAVSDGGKMGVSGEHPEERAKIPYALGDSLRRAIEWNDCEVGADTDHDGGAD
jgi:hypothetical protein